MYRAQLGKYFRRIVLPAVAVFAPALLIAACSDVHFNSTPVMPTLSVSVNPVSIMAGDSATLTVSAVNAVELTVNGSDGSSYNFQSTGGSQKVNPDGPTTYTATASGTGGTKSATADLQVTAAAAAPTVSIHASPQTIVKGADTTLAVAAKGATAVTVASSNGRTFTLKASGGTLVLTPTLTTTYTATATGASGKATAATVVTVTADTGPKPTVHIAAQPTSIKQGSSSILTVTATNSTAVTITGSDGTTYNMAKTGGTKAVVPAKTTEYTVTATGAGGKASETVTIDVTPNPAPTVTITANPVSIKDGGTSTLTVTAMHAATVTVAGTNGAKFTMKSNGGIQSIHPAVTTTYTATATGPGGKKTADVIVKVAPNPPPAVTIVADPTTIISGNASSLKVTATNATTVKVTGSDGSSFSLSASGGTKSVTPTKTTEFKATATGTGGTASSDVTITVDPPATLTSIDHVIFMMQENHTFDNYFGMLNPYRTSDNKKWNIGDDGKTYNVDGIDDKLKTANEDDEGKSFSLFKMTSTCIDDESSDWLASYGDINRYDFLTTRPILADGFVHDAEGYAKSCAKPGAAGSCSGAFTDLTGQRAMGYYDQGFLNYYYYMASQFALSDRWFSPVASKSIDNRIATFTGGTTQGLVKDPGGDDGLTNQLDIPNIFEELDQAKVSWKIYYTVTQGFCLDPDDCPAGSSEYPATDFSNLSYSFRFLYENPGGDPCTAPTQPSSVVGDSSNSFCIDPTHIAPISAFIDDLKNSALPSFAFIEAGYGNNDEHPGSGQSILFGQAQVANLVNTFMASPEWSDSVFFLSYDEGGGPYEHVPPVPGHSNDNTDAALGTIPDISQIAVNPDDYNPCLPPDGTPTLHCDLTSIDPGANAGDAAAAKGFAAQLGFRLPNMVISPFTRRHYVSHIPMDHTAVIKFVENRFIGSAAHLTARDAAQPNLLDFFDFNAIPWATPPVPPTPVSAETLGYNPCTPAKFAP